MNVRMYPLSFEPYFTHDNITTHENVINKAGHNWTETVSVQFFVLSLLSTKWAPLPFLCQTECNNQHCLVTCSEQRSLCAPVLYRPAPGPGISGYIQLAPVHSGSGSVLAPELFMFQPKCFPSLPALYPTSNVISESFYINILPHTICVLQIFWWCPN